MVVMLPQTLGLLVNNDIMVEYYVMLLYVNIDIATLF